MVASLYRIAASLMHLDSENDLYSALLDFCKKKIIIANKPFDLIHFKHLETHLDEVDQDSPSFGKISPINHNFLRKQTLSGTKARGKWSSRRQWSTKYVRQFLASYAL